MRRSIVLTIVLLGIVTATLMVSLALVGKDLDATRIDRDGLAVNVEDLQQGLDTLQAERATLKRQAEERLQATEQLKADLDREHSSSLRLFLRTLARMNSVV